VLRYAINLHHTEETLKKSEERFRVLIENSSDIITILASDGTVLFESPAVERVFGYHSKELVGRKIFEFVHPDDREYVEENFKKAIKHRILNQRIEFRFRHTDGSWRIIEAIGSTTLDETHGLIAVVNSRDVTERVQLEEQLLSLSLDDQLTGLLNRRGFLSFGVQQLKLAKRTKQEICLLFADVDRMKEINDTYGHQHGDKTLVEVAQILRETYREPDIIGRLGGDEFAVLAIGAAEANAVTLVSRLHARVQARNAQKDHRDQPISLSMGVVHYDPAHPCPIEELLSRADTLMYEHKRFKR
jgi:diguanylate cyclase (GGDEF)-like protein/PAS domain S-box-containing protein